MNKLHRIVRLGKLGQILWTKDRGTGQFAGDMFFMSHLKAEVVRNSDGRVLRKVNLGSGVVTTAGVNLMGADWTSASAVLKLANQHDSGTGTGAEAIGDTALGTPTGNARVAGVQSNVNNVYTSVATLTYAGAAAITEWGLFTAAAGVTLWDRRKFAQINVDATISIKFTYNLTINAGG